jgi:hypothetical protein
MLQGDAGARQAAASGLVGVIDGALSARMLYGTSREVSMVPSAEAVLKSFEGLVARGQ